MSSSNLIQTNATCVLHNNWRDICFVCISIFFFFPKAITNLKTSPEDNLDYFYRENETVFVHDSTLM